jgi:UDP-N-acetylmuramoyl-L-alanyl-D-glutamate--2,6-diaminopimelate ligase
MNAEIRKFRGLAADSRDVRPGFLFAALPGKRTDGARFIADAVQRGAIAVLGAPETAEAVHKAGVEFIPAANPRRRLAQIAAQFYGAQPDTVAAVTGTNGKTSVASFLRQIWTLEGRAAASLGTVGIDAPSGHVPLSHTTPDPIAIARELARLKHEGVAWLALEASSHGLDQYRLDGVRIAAGAFTNITRDHLDYHANFEDYLAAKLRLFRELVADGGVAVANMDAAHAGDFAQAAKDRHLRFLGVGCQGEELRLAACEPHAHGQTLTVVYRARKRSIALPLAASFQASNALIAAAVALGLGAPDDAVFRAMERLKGAPGRLELVARDRSGAPIYIDYAHTPDAIETVLKELRPHVTGRLHIVFGCGGDRDRGKRPLMGAAAARYADAVIVTDDNPRTEDAAAIRREALAACPGAREIGDRAEAIGQAIASLGPGDVLVLAGKGHEQTQIVGDVALPFSDRSRAIEAARALGGTQAGEGG